MSTEEFSNNNHVKLTELQLVESEFGYPLEVCYKKAIKYYKGREISNCFNLQHFQKRKDQANWPFHTRIE